MFQNKIKRVREVVRGAATVLRWAIEANRENEAMAERHARWRAEAAEAKRKRLAEQAAAAALPSLYVNAQGDVELRGRVSPAHYPAASGVHDFRSGIQPSIELRVAPWSKKDFEARLETIATESAERFQPKDL